MKTFLEWTEENKSLNEFQFLKNLASKVGQGLKNWGTNRNHFKNRGFSQYLQNLSGVRQDIQGTQKELDRVMVQNDVPPQDKSILQHAQNQLGQ